MINNKLQLSKVAFSILLALMLLVTQTSAASGQVLTPQVECNDNGGTWVASLILAEQPAQHVRARPAPGSALAAKLGVPVGSDGTCTYPSGNAVALSVCGVGYSLARTYVSGSLTSQSCTRVGDYYYGECSDRQEGASQEPAFLTPCGGQNGSATFEPGACATECTVGTGLPSVANSHLPADAIATLYVRVVGADGQPSNDSYTACFANLDGIELTLYRFVSGEWRALVTSSGNPICASASGDGSFYIGAAE